MNSLHKAAKTRLREEETQRKKAREQVSKTRRRALKKALKRRRGPVHATLNVVGLLGAIGVALAFNLAMFPEAVAEERPLLFAIQALHAEPIPADPAQIDADAKVAATPAPDPAAVHLLAATAWAEARSEGEEGMRAVAHVIVNRVGPRFGDDISTVVLSPKQFSSWNLHDPNRPLAQNPERYARGGENLTTWETAQEVALEVLTGQSKDPTNGALFYHTRAVHPRWARYGVGVHTIGAHIFYADVPDHPVRRA